MIECERNLEGLICLVEGRSLLFKQFSAGVYSDGFSIAAAICGAAHSKKIFCVDVWEPGSKELRDWIQDWAEKLKKIGPIHCNESGLAAAKLIGQHRNREPDIKPIDLKLELSEIDGSLYPGWERLKEEARQGIRKREVPATSGAVLLGANCVKKALRQSTVAPSSRPLTPGRQETERLRQQRQQRRRRF